jgi:hypothetical protein
VSDFADVTQHPEELLSALLDGELTAEDAELVQAHIVGCPACTAELDEVRHVRSAVRSLTAVEPPAGFLESLLEVDEPYPANVIPLRARRAAIANAAAAVAAGLLILAGIGESHASTVSPEVTGSVERHAATISAVTAGLGGPSPILAPEEVTPTTEPSRSTELPHPYSAPPALGDYQLVQAFDAPHGVHLLYEKGPYALSVFEVKGDLDADDLPRHTTHVDFDDDDAYRWDGGTAAGRVLVFERGGVVFTLVGDESSAAVLDAAHGLRGGRHASLATRMRRGCSELLDGLSPAS